MSTIRLRAILFGVDFRKSEYSNYLEFRKSRRFPGELRAGESYLFVSKRLNQLVWISNFIVGDKHEIIDSRRWRMIYGSWNPDLLADYAQSVGLSLQGFKKFESGYDKEKRKFVHKR